MSTTTPLFIRQKDGSRCQWSNCGLAVTSMAILRHYESLDPRYYPDAPWPPTPEYLRNKLTPDTCRGTNLNPDNFTLARDYYGMQLEYRYDLPFEDFKTVIRSGKGAGVHISYQAMHGTVFDTSPLFNGNHAVFVNEYRESDDKFKVGDPLATWWAWWPASLLRDGAGLASGEPGNVDCNFTRDTEGNMIPITNESPKYLSAKVGKAIYFTDGTRWTTLSSGDIVNRLSPYGTTVAGVDYRIVRATRSGIKYVFMMKVADVTLTPVTLTGG